MSRDDRADQYRGIEKTTKLRKEEETPEEQIC
jgi:hypothetical protein